MVNVAAATSRSKARAPPKEDAKAGSERANAVSEVSKQEKQILRILKRFDSNKNKQLERDEVGKMLVFMKGEDIKEKIKKKALNAKTKEEKAKYAVAVEPTEEECRVSPAEVDFILVACDKNLNGVIDYNEMLPVLKTYKIFVREEKKMTAGLEGYSNLIADLETFCANNANDAEVRDPSPDTHTSLTELMTVLNEDLDVRPDEVRWVLDLILDFASVDRALRQKGFLDAECADTAAMRFAHVRGALSLWYQNFDLRKQKGGCQCLQSCRRK